MSYPIQTPDEATREDIEQVGDIPAEILDAIVAAINGTAVDADRVKVWAGGEYRSDAPDHELAVVTADYPETAISTGDGPEDFAWLPPYRCREDFDAVLRDELPSGVEFEALTNCATGFYQF